MRKYNYDINKGLTPVKTKTKKIVATVASSMVMAVGVTVPALAAKGPIGTIFSGSDPGTVGPGISGEIYGNTSNPSGNGNGVLPSLSPGPWVCTNPQDCAGPTSPGGSMGDFVSPTASSGHSSSNFANDKTPGPDFSTN